MNIYVGNLSRLVTEEKLRSLFAQFGTVTSVKLIKDKFTGQPKGFAFVEMGSANEAQTAITELNGQELEGQRLRVNEARPREAMDSRPRGPRMNNRY
ncbi:MAG: RNA-binding protein [Candidatus Dependentiae bacterium]|nr:RNA-binding protein [Candidatus Dependentiae bacterium]